VKIVKDIGDFIIAIMTVALVSSILTIVAYGISIIAFDFSLVPSTATEMAFIIITAMVGGFCGVIFWHYTTTHT